MSSKKHFIQVELTDQERATLDAAAKVQGRTARQQLKFAALHDAEKRLKARVKNSDLVQMSIG